MEWTMYIVIGLCVLTIALLVMNYFNQVEIYNLRQVTQHNTNNLDGVNNRLRDNEYNNRDIKYYINSRLSSVEHTLKHNYSNNTQINEMLDIHNARINSYHEDLTRNHEELISYRNVLRRLEPLAPLADKFDLKKRIKATKEYQADLVSDLKETERELKGIA
jgi:chromosome segregation ATPase